MKTKEEITALRQEVEALHKKLAELTDEELKEVVGGYDPSKKGESDVFFHPESDKPGQYEYHLYKL